MSENVHVFDQANQKGIIGYNVLLNALYLDSLLKT
jgi:hypothetical protein